MYCLEYSNTQYQITVNLKLLRFSINGFCTAACIFPDLFSYVCGLMKNHYGCVLLGQRRIEPPSITPLYINLNLNKQKRYFLIYSRNSPGQNTGVGILSLLQGIFPTQGSNPGIPHCRQILYQLSHKGSPTILEWVAFPSPADLPDPGIELQSPALQVDSISTELTGKPVFSLSLNIKNKVS